MSAKRKRRYLMRAIDKATKYAESVIGKKLAECMREEFPGKAIDMGDIWNSGRAKITFWIVQNKIGRPVTLDVSGVIYGEINEAICPLVEEHIDNGVVRRDRIGREIPKLTETILGNIRQILGKYSQPDNLHHESPPHRR